MQDFKWKKGWERVTQKRRWNKPFPASIQSSNLPQGESANSHDWVWRWDLQKPCNQNKKYPTKRMRVFGSWHSHWDWWEWSMPFWDVWLSGHWILAEWEYLSSVYFGGHDSNWTCFSCLFGVHTRTDENCRVKIQYMGNVYWVITVNNISNSII